jgi:hypothetical protein
LKLGLTPSRHHKETTWIPLQSTAFDLAGITVVVKVVVSLNKVGAVVFTNGNPTEEITHVVVVAGTKLGKIKVVLVSAGSLLEKGGYGQGIPPSLKW